MQNISGKTRHCLWVQPTGTHSELSAGGRHLQDIVVPPIFVVMILPLNCA